MTQHFPLDHLDIVHQGFFDPIQEMLSGAAPRLPISVQNTTTLLLTASTGHGQASLSIEGRYRFRTTNQSAALPGSLPDGWHPVYATAEDNDFTGSTATPDSPTNYSFSIEVKQSGSFPSTEIYRQVGEVLVTSSAIEAYRQLAGNRPEPSPAFHVADHSSQSALRLQGAASQSAPILLAENSAGTDILSLLASGNLTIAGQLSAATLADALISTFIPPGTIWQFGGSAAPTGWLLCQGQSLLRAGTYAALFAAIGTAYGSVDGTHFNVPDLQDKMLIGKSGTKALGATGGAATVTLTPAQTAVRDHTHAVTGLTVDEHTHDSGNLVADAHKHDSGTIGLADPYAGLAAAPSYATQTGGSEFGLNIANALLNSGTRAALKLRSGGVLDGDTGTEAPDILNDTGPASTDGISGTVDVPSGHHASAGQNAQASHENLPPYVAANFIIKI